MASEQQQPSFEDAYNELRATIEALEAGNLPLEEATKLFDTGMRLAKTCNELLSAAELRVARLQRSFGEQMAMLQASEPSESDIPEPDDDADDD